MRNRKKRSFMSMFMVLVLFLVIVLVVGLISKYTSTIDKVKDLINPVFHVEYNGKDYTGSDNVIVLPTEGQAQFTVKGAESYKITLKPNVTIETDFSYSIGNAVYNYSQVDLSKVFISDNSLKDNSFFLNCLDDYSLESVLSRIHGETEIVLYGGVRYPYLLAFSTDSTAIEFLLGSGISVKVDSVELSENKLFL